MFQVHRLLVRDQRSDPLPPPPPCTPTNSPFCPLFYRNPDYGVCIIGVRSFVFCFWLLSVQKGVVQGRGCVAPNVDC